MNSMKSRFKIKSIGFPGFSNKVMVEKTLMELEDTEFLRIYRLYTHFVTTRFFLLVVKTSTPGKINDFDLNKRVNLIHRRIDESNEASDLMLLWGRNLKVLNKVFLAKFGYKKEAEDEDSGTKESFE